MRKRLLAIALLLAAAVAQQCPAPRTITVSGTGEIKVVPDQISFVIAVSNFSPTAKAAKAENERRSAAIIRTLAEAGVDAKDYQARGVGIETRHKKGDDSREVLGYVATNEISVLLRDLTKLDTLTDKAMSLGATAIEQSVLSTSSLLESRVAARKMALESAKRKATEMTAVLGVAAGKVLSIAEAGQSYTGRGSLTANSFAYNGDTSASVAAGVISVSESVTVTFELQ